MRFFLPEKNNLHNININDNSMKILITGGCGYTGSILVPYLLKLGHKITVIDTMWFGNYLKKNSGLKIILSVDSFCLSLSV